MQRDDEVVAALEAVRGAARRARRSAAASRRACRSSCCRRSGSRSLGEPLAQQVVARLGRVDEEQVGDARRRRRRLISSGIVRSKLRRPASTWPTGMPSFAATSAAASVEFTSPGTSTTSGLRLEQHRLEALHHARRLLRVRARADAEQVVRLADAELLEEDRATSRRRSAGRCGRARARTRPAGGRARRRPAPPS